MWTTEDVMEVDEVAAPIMTVNGNDFEVEDGDDFVETVKSAARDFNLSKFRVIVDGEEIDPMDAPETIENGMVIEIRQYDVAG
jgi:hypothetical protein